MSAIREKSFRRERSDRSEATSRISTFFDENWKRARGHYLTYFLLVVFSINVFYRPFELFPALEGLNALVLPLAIVMLAVFVPLQFFHEGRLSVVTTELKCVAGLTVLAILTIPIAIDPPLAIETFRESLLKVALVFIVLVNILSTRKRLLGLSWMLIAAGWIYGYQTVQLYRSGVFNTEGYRVSLGGGMIGNPNEMALFMLMIIPLCMAVTLTAKSILIKILGVSSLFLLTVSMLLTQSRGGFLGLMSIAAVFVWRLGKKHRIRTIVITTVVAIGIMAFAPGNYGLRIASIFIPSLDPVGSSGERREALNRSLRSTFRKPLGVGIGNSRIFGYRNLETHNSFTQVSSELGLVGFGFFVVFLISPLKKLIRIERGTAAISSDRWYYFMSISLQGCIVAFMVSSFFASVAYHWYIYYPMAFAVGLRRLYHFELMDRQLDAEGDTRSIS